MNPLIHFENIDWSNWTPQERATLLSVRCGRHVLLIRKKRGLRAEEREHCKHPA
jgi:hypothetical protein